MTHRCLHCHEKLMSWDPSDHEKFATFSVTDEQLKIFFLCSRFLESSDQDIFLDEISCYWSREAVVWRIPVFVLSENTLCNYSFALPDWSMPRELVILISSYLEIFESDYYYSTKKPQDGLESQSVSCVEDIQKLWSQEDVHYGIIFLH